MVINVDIIIFVGFLVANLALGLWSSRGISGIKEYAIGNRNFSTFSIAATLVATWASGQAFFTILSETYTNGLYFIWSVLGYNISLLLIGLFFAPRMSEFLGSLSIAEAMGNLFGKQVKIITAMAGFIAASGMIALQLKVSGFLFEYCFGLPGVFGIIIGGIIITIYSSLGGINSVTFTDAIQFFTFGTMIPALALFILGSLDSIELLTNTIATNNIFDYKEVFDFSRPKSFYYIFFFLFNAIPAFNPAFFQRIAMAQSTAQVRKSFVIAAFTCLFIILIISFIGMLMLSIKPGINGEEVFKHILFDYSYPGLTGLILIGIMAMIMSTADSYLNATSVLFVNDFCKPLGIKLIKNELLFLRVFSFIIGVSSILLAMKGGNLVQMIIATNTLYMPIVTVPFILAILGFRSSGKAVLIGMGSGFVTVITWDFLLKISFIDSLVPGMMANTICLIGSHYLLGQAGGWVGIKDYTPIKIMRAERIARFHRFINSLLHFNLFTFLRKNSPNNESTYVYFGLFCIISLFSNIYSIPKGLPLYSPALVSFTAPTVLFASTALLSYPLWFTSWKETAMMAIIWNIIAFYVLICVGFSFVIISNFAPIQLMIFMVNLILVAISVKWQWALCMITVGIFSTIQFLKSDLILGDIITSNETSFQFKIIYMSILVSSILIAFLKPKQEHQELTEEQNNHLEVMIKDREEELGKAQKLKHEFLRNLEHEVNAPLVGLTSLAPMVLEDFDRLSPKQMKKYVKNIVDSHERYKTLSDNLLDLSKLDSMKYKLDKVKLDLSDLIKARLDYCRRLYMGKKELEFAMDIDPGVIIECDEHYITSLIDNLVINAIKYSKEGEITLKLHRKEIARVEFQIIDEGIGIPKLELNDIFGAFVVSSKTRTPSGGRGIGLALCKKIAEVHGGSIRADSDGEKGAAFILELPI